MRLVDAPPPAPENKSWGKEKKIFGKQMNQSSIFTFHFCDWLGLYCFPVEFNASFLRASSFLVQCPCPRMNLSCLSVLDIVADSAVFSST